MVIIYLLVLLRIIFLILFLFFIVIYFLRFQPVFILDSFSFIKDIYVCYLLTIALLSRNLSLL